MIIQCADPLFSAWEQLHTLASSPKKQGQAFVC